MEPNVEGRPELPVSPLRRSSHPQVSIRKSSQPLESEEREADATDSADNTIEEGKEKIVVFDAPPDDQADVPNATDASTPLLVEDDIEKAPNDQEPVFAQIHHHNSDHGHHHHEPEIRAESAAAPEATPATISRQKVCN